MNRICNSCKIETDENNYLKKELFARVVTIKIEEKSNNQKLIKSTITMMTTLMFQHMKIMPISLLDRETWQNLIRTQNPGKNR